MTAPDWAALRSAAVEAMRRAYAPYSGFPVGAAGLVDDGRVVVGCNVENASYGLTLCAECGVVSALCATGGGRLTALACVDGAGEPLMPCGRCRQLLWEHGGPECLVDAEPEPVRLAELLPHAFGAADLAGPAPEPPGAPSVPSRLAVWRGKGTVFVHVDMVGGKRVWTAYWERSSGFAPAAGGGAGGGPEDESGGGQGAGGLAGPDAPTASAAAGAQGGGAGAPGGPAGAGGPVAAAAEPAGILEEAPHWPDAADAVAWGRARTPRVVVVDADGALAWAGEGPPPAPIEGLWE